jgi:hypothetical protein
MRKRPVTRTNPGIEPLEQKRLPSAGVSAALLAHAQALQAARNLGGNPARPVTPALVLARHAHQVRQAPPSANHHTVSAQLAISNHGYAMHRITNTNPFNSKMTPPFGHVNVQVRPPVPGQTYNVLYIVARNGTAQTFTAEDGFLVRFPGSTHDIPVLTGNQTWKPDQWIIFYVLTKKYYPVPNVVSSGYYFNMDGIYSSAIPGPSGIFLRLRYNPATINRVLDRIVTTSQGPESGSGIKYGLPDTALYEVLSARTDRMDWGGYF